MRYNASRGLNFTDVCGFSNIIGKEQEAVVKLLRPVLVLAGVNMSSESIALLKSLLHKRDQSFHHLCQLLVS